MGLEGKVREQVVWSTVQPLLHPHRSPQAFFGASTTSASAANWAGTPAGRSAKHICARIAQGQRPGSLTGRRTSPISVGHCRVAAAWRGVFVQPLCVHERDLCRRRTHTRVETFWFQDGNISWISRLSSIFLYL